jgi:hypothetical protein
MVVNPFPVFESSDCNASTRAHVCSSEEALIFAFEATRSDASEANALHSGLVRFAVCAVKGAFFCVHWSGAEALDRGSGWGSAVLPREGQIEGAAGELRMLTGLGD